VEPCFWSGDGEWHESRAASGQAGIRVMKGLYLRVGGVALSPVARAELQLLGTGTVYITSRRILLTGAQKGHELRYSSVLGIEVFSDAIRVEKASGRSSVLVLPDPEVPAAILAAVLADQP
jgi:hypothetical protein